MREIEERKEERLIMLLRAAQEQVDGIQDEKKREKEKKLEGAATWTFSYSVVVNPQVMCPGCKNFVRTRVVWAIDEREEMERVIYAFNARDGKRLSLDRLHPHVSNSGWICLGNTATSPIEALFCSLTPTQEFPGSSVVNYLRGLGHGECGELVDLLIQKEREEEGEDDDNETYTCERCRYEVYSADDLSWDSNAEESCCDSCIQEMYWICDLCDHSIYGDRDTTGVIVVSSDKPYLNNVVCEDCLDDCFECDRCGGLFVQDEHSLSDKYPDERRCDGCWRLDYGFCEKCGEENELVKMNEDKVCRDCEEERVVALAGMDELEELGQQRLWVEQEGGIK